MAQAVMPKGSAVFWLGKAFRGLGASLVNEPRTGILFTMVTKMVEFE